VVRPSSKIVQGSIDLIVSIPFWDQLSSARRSRTACSEGADIACRISRSLASGPQDYEPVIHQ
jgi:hypothetical protein